tara:strand:+ start:672 stop:893 length:222 start_codon:yes stop_codon:yes gene_type:complete
VRLQLELKDFLTEEQIKLLIELQEVLQEGSTSPDGTKVPLSPEVCCNADDLCREIAMSILTSTRNMTGGLRGV